MEELRRFRVFMAWNDEREERWLERMAAEGWYLDGVRFPGIYRFRPGDPLPVSYRLDFFADKDYASYRQLFEDAGWRLVCSYGGWQYFRNDSGSGKEIFTDRGSKASKYKRVLAIVAAILPSQFIGASILSKARAADGVSRLLPAPVAFAGSLFFMATTCLFAWSILRLAARIRGLRQPGER